MEGGSQDQPGPPLFPVQCQAPWWGVKEPRKVCVTPEACKLKLYLEMRGKSTDYRKLSQIGRGSQDQPELPYSHYHGNPLQFGWSALLLGRLRGQGYHATQYVLMLVELAKRRNGQIHIGEPGSALTA